MKTKTSVRIAPMLQPDPMQLGSVGAIIYALMSAKIMPDGSHTSVNMTHANTSK